MCLAAVTFVWWLCVTWASRSLLLSPSIAKVGFGLSADWEELKKAMPFLGEVIDDRVHTIDLLKDRHEMFGFPRT